MNKELIKHGVNEILKGLGDLKVDKSHYEDTDRRVADMYEEVFSGLYSDPPELKIFHDDVDQMIVSDNIPFCSFCIHHMLPFRGYAKIGYIPRDGKIVGISKLARVLDYYAKRPTVQEIITNQVADYLFDNADLNPLGVGVILKASHDCEVIRGVKKEGCVMVTSALRGQFFRKEVREEFMEV